MQELFPEKFWKFFGEEHHLQLERWDKDKNFEAMQEYIDRSQVHREFFDYHKQMTTPIFGKWEWDTRSQAEIQVLHEI